MRHCAFCNTELPNLAQFCGYCGHLTNIMEAHTFSASATSVQDGSTFISDASLSTSLEEQRDVRGYIPPTLHNNAVWTPPVSQQAYEEEEQDRRRRALVWGVPLAESGNQGPAGAPTIQGTPHLSSVSIAPGTPNMVPPPRTQYPYQAPPQLVQVARIQSEPGGRTRKHKTSSKGARAAKSAALKWLIVVFTGALVLATAGVGVTLAFSPTLSSSGLSGNSVVVQGHNLSLHGKGFLPGGHVTLKRDNGKAVQLASQNTPNTHINANLPVSIDVAALSNLSLDASTNTSIIVNSSGTFDATLLIGRDWLRGEHTILAKEDVFARSALLTVNIGDALPALVVTPGSLDFGSVQTGTKTSVTLAIGNTGGQPLTWTAATDGTQWLSLQATSGGVLPYGVPQSLVVMCDATALAVGTYSATIHMNSNGGPANINVSLRIVAQPQAKLSVSPAILDFQTMGASQQATQAITISNTGTIKLDWQATSNQDWAILDTAGASIQPGDGAQNIGVQVDTTGMKAGSYAATVTITSNGGNAQVPITLIVPSRAIPTPPPPTATPLPPTPVPTITPTVGPTATPTTVPQGTICKLPASLDFGPVLQGQTVTRALTLGNCGDASFTWKPLSDSNWITVDNVTGATLAPNAFATVNVTIDTRSLTGSTGQGKITFYTSVGNQAVTVMVTVQQPHLTPAPATISTPTPTAVPIG